MFILRLLRRDGGRIDSDSEAVFEGIRTEEKLKTFLMSDLITYYIYRKLSDDYFASGKKGDERKQIDEVMRISKAVALFYAGNPTGTPADQIAKRVTNLICMLRKERVVHTDAAVTVNEGNIGYYHDFFDSRSEGGQIAAKVELDTECVEKMRSIHGYSAGVPGYLAMADIVDWIISEVLEKSRGDPSLQSIMKIQYDLMRDLFSVKAEIQDNLKLDVVRMYLAIAIVLKGSMQHIGNVYEPVVTPKSFSVIIPFFRKPPMTENLLIVGSTGTEKIINQLDLSDSFNNIRVSTDTIDSWDQELMLYGARLNFGYTAYNLMMIDDGGDPDWAGKLIGSIERIAWFPKHAVVVSDCIDSSGIGFPCSLIDYGDRDPGQVIEDISNAYTTGIRSNDRFAEAVMRTTFRDILALAYPKISEMIDGYPKRSDSIALFNTIKDHIIENDPLEQYENRELVASLIAMICDVGKESDK